jgi:hypothetical protein
VVRVTDSYGSILGFLGRRQMYSIEFLTKGATCSNTNTYSIKMIGRPNILYVLIQFVLYWF